MHKLYGYEYFVNDQPFCVWGWDIDKNNRDFINSIESEYFKHLSDIYSEELENENKHIAALAMRASYLHALETFFTFLLASLQAPRQILAWILRCNNTELRKMVKDINNNKADFNIQHKLDRLNWKSISYLINQYISCDKALKDNILQLYSEMWKRFSFDFIDDELIAEYNSIKHGMRTSSGGFSLAIGIEKKYGVPPSPKEMSTVGTNEYGTSYYTSNFMSDKKEYKHNIYIKNHSVNWNPEIIANSLDLISWSINNIKSFLRIILDYKDYKAIYFYPDDIQNIELIMQKPMPVKSLTIGPDIKDMNIKLPTKDDIIDKIK